MSGDVVLFRSVGDGSYNCHQVLQANNDARAAQLLAAAYHRLQAQAATVDDEQLRQSF